MAKRIHNMKCGVEYLKALWQSMKLFELAVLRGHSIPVKI